MSSSDSTNIIKLRGLPWGVTRKQILDFLNGVEVDGGEDGIYLISFSNTPARANGEAFVVCADDASYNRAFELHNKRISHRYIEVLRATKNLGAIIQRQQNIKEETVIRLRGLPWNTKTSEIADFFSGLELNKECGIHIQLDKLGRASGEAYVRFANIEDYEQGLQKHMEKIGERFIEIFQSSLIEMRRSIQNTRTYERRSSRRTPYDRDSGDMDRRVRRGRNNRDYIDPWVNNPFQSNFGNRNMNMRNNYGGGRNSNSGFHNDYNSNRNNFMSNNNEFLNGNDNGYNGVHYGGVNYGGVDYGGVDSFAPNFGNRGTPNGKGPFRLHIRGFPYFWDKVDIMRFFLPVVAVNVKLLDNHDGLNGAEVFFASFDDAMLAMKKDREKIDNRHIELFFGNLF